ncbi:hypothetical protein EGR_03860 [Echinococcus granulosus]|uniref:Uncharacterized protein n=1 Tax=Echinococcus granulosus TaxID=6210 RepID=W6V548_ECHGR|nr:hypothetical protein EGR_03860 [Echinococcus granulosus]EUB61374.1 hypothetical protein EGR_03860 [Echinococcus granulosus]
MRSHSSGNEKKLVKKTALILFIVNLLIRKIHKGKQEYYNQRFTHFLCSNISLQSAEYYWYKVCNMGTVHIYGQKKSVYMISIKIYDQIGTYPHVEVRDPPLKCNNTGRLELHATRQSSSQLITHHNEQRYAQLDCHAKTR